MKIIGNLRTYLLGTIVQGWNISDKPGIFYYQTKSYADRFLLKRKPSNRIVSAGIGGDRVYFRDNWFDPRTINLVFENDYNGLDRGIFRGMSCFVDAGANIGLISKCARRESPDCKIICFEPLEENAKICKLNNPDATVEVIGLGSKDGTADLLVDECGFMASSISFGYRQKPRKLNIATLDSYFGSQRRIIDLLKIDVEGMEVEVLKGAEKTLGNTRKVIAEIHSEKLLEEFSGIMEKYGFEQKRTVEIEKNTYISYWINRKMLHPEPDG